MKVTSKAITDGITPDKYGSKGNVFVNGMPRFSILLDIEEAPEGTQSFADIVDDYDAVSVCRFN